MKALYIGRFQGFHLGHLDTLRYMDAAPDVDTILVALGSSQYDHRRLSPAATWAANPFTVEERTEMIEASAAGQLDKRLEVWPVPDQHNWQRWGDWIAEQLPEFSILYTCDRNERTFFGAGGIEVRDFPRERAFHAGVVRQLLAEGGDWQHMVPAPAAAVLERIDAGARMREMYARDRALEESG